MIEIIGALSNAIRCGQFKLPAGNWINAGLFGLVVAFKTMNPWLALASTAAMFIGAAPGWGHYIGALGSWEHENLKGNKYIDRLITPLTSQPRLWGAVGLFLRGLFWGLCLAVPFACFGGYETAMWLVAMGSTMPACYGAAIYWAKKFEKYTMAWNAVAWSLGELVYGAILWGAL